MTDAPRVAALQRMLESRPDDDRIRFALALEYEKLERWEDAVTELRAYLDGSEDEGNAWGRLGNALRRLGRDEEARDAYRTGIETAHRHGHPSMAAEFEAVLEEMND
ncbi:MAG TPA: tetratricopeptide repeat protein [Longimicrobiales bacterium]|nr:tetratricopeptide repeat protein [Longimicrobiales bacterium]